MNTLQLAIRHGTPKKAFFTALLVGTILVGVNHGDDIIMGKLPHPAIIIMTYLVPYLVTTWGSILGKKSNINRTKNKNEDSL